MSDEETARVRESRSEGITKMNEVKTVDGWGCVAGMLGLVAMGMALGLVVAWAVMVVTGISWTEAVGWTVLGAAGLGVLLLLTAIDG